MSLDLVDNGTLLHILQYVGAGGSARLGLSSNKWNEKILRGGIGDTALWKSFAVDRWGDYIFTSYFAECPNPSSYFSTDDECTWYGYYRRRSARILLLPDSDYLGGRDWDELATETKREMAKSNIRTVAYHG
jgi:hypothetical protein